MSEFRNFATRGLSAVILAALAACGGGGGGGETNQGSNPPPAGGTSVLAGGWSGSAGAGEGAQVFVLADGTAWVFTQSAAPAPLDMVVGGLVLSNGALSATGMNAFDYETTSATTATAAGSYVVGSRMDFTITPAAGAAIPIAVTAVGTTDYNPARAAVLSDIAGPWGGAFRSTETGVVAIGTDGTIQNFTTSLGCSGLGTVSPRANENVFDVTLTLGPEPCAAPGATATGTAFVVGSGPTARLYIGAKTPSGSQGASFIGKRP